jgi:hypothetical protein
MAHVLIAFDLDVEETEVSAILDRVSEAVEQATGSQPMFGLEIDGEHRDPDDPLTDLFS